MIRNVVAVYRLQCENLPNDSPVSLVSSIEMIKEQGGRIDIVVPARLSINNKVVDKNHLFEYQLVFKTCQHLEVRGHWAYAVDLADGSQLLIGSSSRPYPVTVSSQSIPDNLTDSQLTEVTVTLTLRSELPLFP